MCLPLILQGLLPLSAVLSVLNETEYPLKFRYQMPYITVLIPLHQLISPPLPDFPSRWPFPPVPMFSLALS